MIYSRTSSGLKPSGNIRVRTASGLSAAANIRLRDATGLKVVWSATGPGSPGGGAYAVTALPLTAGGYRARSGPTSVSTEAVTVTVSGGLEPYSYAWSLVSSGGGTWTIESPTSPSSRFTRAAVDVDTTWSATFKCTVTDARGFTAYSPNVEATVGNYGGVGGFIT